MSDETESPRTAPVTRYRAGANSTSNTRGRWPMDSSLHRLNPQSSRLPFRRPGSVSVAIWPSLASFCTTKNRVAVADSTPNDGEAPV